MKMRREVEVLYRFLEKGRIMCLYCVCYNPDVGCEEYIREKGEII